MLTHSSLRVALALILVLFAIREGKALAGEGPERNLRFLPDHLDYRHYIADPRRPRIGGSVLKGDHGEVHYDTAIGGAFALVDLPSWPPPFERLQFAGFACVYSRFDYDAHYDEIGHDVRVGFSLSAVHNPWAARFQYFHESDHLGDEYILRQGITDREPYLREELGVGVSYFPHPAVRLYVEGAYSLFVGTINKPGRAQAGAEWEGGARLAFGFRPYAAGDMQLYQERDWKPDWTAQAGVVKWNQRRDRSLRLFAEGHLGHDPLGEFHLERFNYTSLGFAFEF
jgi:hypothetical protein